MQTINMQALGRRAGLSCRRVAAVTRSRVARVEAVQSGAKPTVLVAEKLGDAGIELLKQYAEVDCSYDMTPEQLCAKISLVDALIVRSGTQVNKAVFDAAKGRLKVVGRAGVGIDNVDLTAATESGCLVVNAPTANTIAAAEHGVALLCAMARNVAQADASMKKGEWKRTKYVGTSLVGKTIAIMGFGKVGSEVARRCRGLGMTAIAYDPYASAEKALGMGVALVSFDEALAAGDFFSLHMPLTPSTKNIFNDESFGKMKRGARIINVARGGVIDEAALVRALDAGIVSQAALDVFPVEPPTFEGHPLINRPDVIVTPHLGASTTEAQEGVAIEVVEAVVEALAGKLSSNAVNAPMVSAEVLKELQPYILLAEGLGKAAVSLVKDTGFSDIEVIYNSPRGDDLDSRLLRAMVIKGLLEGTTTSRVNLVNADLLAKNRGLKISEVTKAAEGTDILSSMSVTIKSKTSLFSGALDGDKGIVVEGSVRGGQPLITKIGTFDVELSVKGSIILVRQMDQPGIVGATGMLLASENVNISYMSVCRVATNGEAIMAIGVDVMPPPETLAKFDTIKGIMEVCVFKEL
jgi:D-3-phosphoglycerate dehydrogenase